MKKLEKNLEYYKDESKRLSDEIQSLRKNASNLNSEFGSRSQELIVLKVTKELFQF